MGGAAGKLAGMDRRGGYEEPTTNERRRRDVASPRRQSEPASRLELETINNRRYDRGSAVTRIISGQISARPNSSSIQTNILRHRVAQSYSESKNQDTPNISIMQGRGVLDSW